MSHKQTTTLIVLVCILGFGFMFARSCGLSDRLKQQKRDYEEYRRIVEIEQVASSNRVDELTNEIGHRDETIVKLKREVTQYVEKTSTLTAELVALQNAEPPTTPEVETLPIVINLRGQVSKLTEMFTLSQAVVTLQRQEITGYVGQIESYKKLVDEWRGAYEREHALRLAAEGLFKSYERQIKLNKTFKMVAIGVGTAYIVGTLIKK